jgi:hypothetical protein
MTETPKPPTEVTEKDLPSLDLVFPLAIKSYETARQRMVTQDNRIQQMITLTLALTGAIPALYQVFGISPRLLFLAAAAVFFFVSIGLLVAATMRCSLQAVAVKSLHEHYIALPQETAKEYLIKYAGEADEENELYLYARHRLIIASTFCIAGEVLLLVLSGLRC